MYFSYLDKYKVEPSSWEQLKNGYMFSTINNYKQNLIQLYASKKNSERKQC